MPPGPLGAISQLLFPSTRHLLRAPLRRKIGEGGKRRKEEEIVVLEIPSGDRCGTGFLIRSKQKGAVAAAAAAAAK